MEKWIKGYEGLYSVTNDGTVFSHKRKGKKILIPEMTKVGYYRVGLSKKGKTKHYSIHRLVALTFLGKMKEGQVVNHIDGNKLNNNVKNLEWCTIAENTQHAFDTGLIPMTAVLMLDKKTGQILEEFNSIKEACKFGKFRSNHISEVCSGKRKTHGGYRWRYKEAHK